MKLVFIILMLLSSSFVSGYDPMAPPGNYNLDKKSDTKKTQKKANKRKGNFNLLQIVINSKTKNAIIDGYIVNEGDYIKNALVKSISEGTVTLVLAGKEMVLTLTNEYPKIRHHHEAYGM